MRAGRRRRRRLLLATAKGKVQLLNFRELSLSALLSAFCCVLCAYSIRENFDPETFIALGGRGQSTTRSWSIPIGEQYQQQLDPSPAQLLSTKIIPMLLLLLLPSVGEKGHPFNRSGRRECHRW